MNRNLFCLNTPSRPPSQNARSTVRRMVLVLTGFLFAGLAPARAAMIVVQAQTGTILHSTIPSLTGAPHKVAMFTQLNPGILQSDDLNPQPLPPGGSQVVDLSDPTHAIFTIDQAANTNGSFIYFGLNSKRPGHVSPDPILLNTFNSILQMEPNSSTVGDYTFSGFERDGDDRLQIHMVIKSPAPIDPGSFVSLNPQPLPPGGGDFSAMQAFKFKFLASPHVDPPFTVEIDVTDLSSGQLLRFDAPTAVPEPSSMILMGAGIVGLFGYGWRKRRKPATA